MTSRMQQDGSAQVGFVVRPCEWCKGDLIPRRMCVFPFVQLYARELHGKESASSIPVVSPC